jgi:hypothetical protein
MSKKCIYFLNDDFILSNTNPNGFTEGNCMWIYNPKRKLRLKILLECYIIDYIRASELLDNSFLVAFICVKGRIDIYRIYIGEGMNYKKVFVFEDDSFPILDLLFCPYDEFDYDKIF